MNFTNEEINVLAQNVLSVTKLTKKTIVVRCDSRQQAKNVYYILKANFPEVGTYILSLDSFVGYGKLTEYIFKNEYQADEALFAIQSAIGQQSDTGVVPEGDTYKQRKVLKWVLTIVVILAVIVAAIFLFPKIKAGIKALK